jgi:hypothetical protein
MRVATMVGTASVALLATSGWAQNVTYDYDRTADFTKLKTYSWVRGKNLSDELNHKRVVAAIDVQLAVKGFTKVDAAGNPDVLVAYHAAFGRDVQISGYAPGWGAYRAGRWGSARTEQILVGALAVEMVDPRTRSTLWRGIASRDVDVDATPEKRERNLNKTAEKLFEKYPPTKGN